MKALFLTFVLFLSYSNINHSVIAQTTSSRVTPETSILFAKKYFAVDDQENAEIINSFILEKNSNLFIRVLLENPLLNYLKMLSPNEKDEVLVAQGNYQFTFIVDDNIIYTENLNQGAGSIKSKSQWKGFMVPLMSKEELDSWGRFLWNRFLSKGGKKALSAGSHDLRIEVRPYLQSTDILVGELIASGNIQINTPVIEVALKKKAIQPIQFTNAFPIDNNQVNPVIIHVLNQEIILGNFPEVTSIVAIKDGSLILEEYFNGAKRKTLHDTRSVGKTIAGTLLGIAIQEGHISSVQQKLSEFYDLSKFENFDPLKAEITLENLLTMSTGMDAFDFDENSPGQEEKMYPTKDWVKFTLDLPMVADLKSGKDWRYFSAGAVLLGDIIDKAVPNGLEKYAEEKLFQPLGITKYKWQHTPTGVANTAGSLKLSALDLAKLGQLYLTNNKQILSPEWIDKSMSKQVDIPFLENEYYGYLLWNKTYKVNGQNYECFYASGNGGNKIFIFKDLPLVVVITAQAFNSSGMHSTIDEIMEQYLLKAVLDSPSKIGMK